MRGASNRWFRRLALSFIYTMGVLGIVASGGGSGGGGSDPTPATPPIAPSALVATATSSSSINLSWTDNSSDESNFVVQRSTTSGSGFATIATLGANTTSYADTAGLSASTTYYYQVYATNGGSGSGFSNEAFSTTEIAPPPPPIAPTGLVATATSSSSINLTWTDNSSDESNFVVQRSTTSGSGFATIATLGSNITSYADTTGLSVSTTYYYQVYATNSAGDSGFSNGAFATTDGPPAPTLPTAPTGLGATATSSSSISLSWTDNSSNETNFVVQRSTTSGSGFATIATLGSNITSYADTTGLSVSTTYYYQVYATNGVGSSGFSNEASATTATDASILVSWDGNPETAVNRSGGGYKVYYSSNSGFDPGDSGVTEIDVPYSSGVSAPTSVLISLSLGTYYIRIAAYSALNAPGTSGGSISTATPQITLTAP